MLKSLKCKVTISVSVAPTQITTTTVSDAESRPYVHTVKRPPSSLGTLHTFYMHIVLKFSPFLRKMPPTVNFDAIMNS